MRPENNSSAITRAPPKAINSQPQPKHVKEHAFKRYNLGSRVEFMLSTVDTPA